MTKQEFNDIIVKRRQDGDVMKNVRSFADLTVGELFTDMQISFFKIL